jgi:hypothetical protein
VLCLERVRKLEGRFELLTPRSDGGLHSDQFLWEGAVEGVAQEGEFVDKEGGFTARGMISWKRQ